MLPSPDSVFVFHCFFPWKFSPSFFVTRSRSFPLSLEAHSPPVSISQLSSSESQDRASSPGVGISYFFCCVPPFLRILFTAFHFLGLDRISEDCAALFVSPLPFFAVTPCRDFSGFLFVSPLDGCKDGFNFL